MMLVHGAVLAIVFCTVHEVGFPDGAKPCRESALVMISSRRGLVPGRARDRGATGRPQQQPHDQCLRHGPSVWLPLARREAIITAHLPDLQSGAGSGQPPLPEAGVWNPGLRRRVREGNTAPQ